MPARRETTPADTETDTVEVEKISVVITTHTKAKDNSSSKKKAAPKATTKTKNKEISFMFAPSTASYLSLLGAILSKHGYEKYTPVTNQHRFPVKVLVPPAKAKKDAIDIDTVSDYQELVQDLTKSEPSKLSIFFDLDDVKAASKATNSDDEDSTVSNTSDKDEKSSIERELARIRGLLEKEYANPDDGGFTYVANDGTKIPLTPTMLLQWAREMYNGKTSLKEPPNTVSFDPEARRRSIFKKAETSEESSLGHVSTIINNLVKITAPHLVAGGIPPSAPIAAPSISSSPAKNTPSKLMRFLQHAEDVLGVADAPSLEGALAAEGYGPDVLADVDQQILVSCGVTPGDAIRLKRGSASWWTSPAAKKPKTVANSYNSPLPPPKPASASTSWDDETPQDFGVRFEKRYIEGGSKSYFGSHVISGKNRGHREFSWWYYNSITRKTEPIPEGTIPVIDPAFQDDPDLGPQYPSSDEDDEGQQGSTSAVEGASVVSAEGSS